ncbi:hypothetical protein SSS_03729 [Sarcoptes scabiei]|uniref:Spire-like protein n=1 Tax=Sarcoptes scabiei TaxID=52283 RepID=A0A834R3U2_SARSC|nr:hypothetical protein SSS_03729 [Sarcoptes scabiei]
MMMNTLGFILETFQCNINQEQAWALIYQSTKTLNELLNDFERKETNSERSIAINDEDNSGDVNRDDDCFCLGRLKTFVDIKIDSNGNVEPSTWIISRDSKSSRDLFEKNSQSIANEDRVDDACSSGSSSTSIKNKTLLIIKSKSHKRITNESINNLIASLATVIYLALEWNWQRKKTRSPKTTTRTITSTTTKETKPTSSSSSTTTTATAVKNFKYIDDDDDSEEEDNDDVKFTKNVQLDNCEINLDHNDGDECDGVDDDDDDDDDQELDLDESLESLMLSMLRGSENKDLVDEGYIDALEENGLHLVLQKCRNHFDELISMDNPKNSIVLEILSTVPRNSINQIGPDYYYRTVCKMMMDEAIKLHKLVKQFCDRTKEQQKQLQQKLSNEHLFKMFNNVHCLDSFQNHQLESEQENLKTWAQTWIKVMSEMRFGVHLRPITPILRSDRTKTSITDHSMLPPPITQKSIVDCLQRLKPVSERKVKPRIDPEPCLHDRLMSEIKHQDWKLRPTLTNIKPSIERLYLEECRHHRINLTEYQSLYDIYRETDFESCSYRRRKTNQGVHLTPISNKSSLLSSISSSQSSPLTIKTMKSEVSLNQLKHFRFETIRKCFNKRKRLSFRNGFNNYDDYDDEDDDNQFPKTGFFSNDRSRNLSMLGLPHQTSTPKINQSTISNSSNDILRQPIVRSLIDDLNEANFEQVDMSQRFSTFKIDSIDRSTMTEFENLSGDKDRSNRKSFNFLSQSISNFATNSYLRRSFIRKPKISEDHRLSSRTEAIPSISSTLRPPRRSMSMLKTFPLSSTSSVSHIKSMNESMEFSTIKNISRTSSTRKSFRLGLNEFWSKLFGQRSNT